MASPETKSPPSKKPKMSSTTSSPSPSDDELLTETTVGACSDVTPAKQRRYKRRKVAIFIGYCGAGYQGMQKNPGAKTIEGDLEEALFHCGAVPAADRGNPRRYDWARAARTDKGVSAAAQVVSGRFYVDPPGFVERMNANLASQIRVFGYKRVTNSFNAKKFCDRRRYVYFLPVFALDPNKHHDRESVVASWGTRNELSKCVECSERGRKVAGLVGRQSKASKEEEKDRIGDGMTLECQSGMANEVLNAKDKNSMVETNASEEVVKDKVAGNEQFEAEEKSVIESTVSVEKLKANSKTYLGEIQPEEKSEPEKRELANEVNATLSTDKESETGHKSMPEAMDLTEEQNGEQYTNGTVENVRAREFQYGEKEKEKFNAILRRYEGTHNFHNFTTRTKAEDPSARRYIISFEADHVVNLDGMDFIRCEVVGQSFMLHQIRKMIGLAVAIMRNCAPESLMDAALKREVSINVPTAPEVGLYLDECLFTSYNKRWNSSHEAVSMETYADQAEDFKMKYIHSHIASMEQKEGAVALWLHSLNHRNYPDFRYVETNGQLVCSKQLRSKPRRLI